MGRSLVSVELGGGDAESCCGRSGVQAAVPDGNDEVRGSQPTRPPATGRRAYYGDMGRIVGTVLGAILAIWLVFTSIGWFSAVFKTFLITALVAAVVFIVVWLLAGRRRQG